MNALAVIIKLNGCVSSACSESSEKLSRKVQLLCVLDFTI